MGPVDHRRGGSARDPRWRLYKGADAVCKGLARDPFCLNSVSLPGAESAQGRKDFADWAPPPGQTLSRLGGDGCRCYRAKRPGSCSLLREHLGVAEDLGVIGGGPQLAVGIVPVGHGALLHRHVELEML